MAPAIPERTESASRDPCNNQRNKPTDIRGPSATEIGHVVRHRLLRL
jgi:hypothetical protein